MAVEIVPNDVWREALGDDTNEREALFRTHSRRMLIQALDRWGPFEDSSGLATRQWLQRAQTLGYRGSLSALSGIMRKPTMAHAVSRDQNAKRVYRIALERVPQAWADWLQPAKTEPEPEPEAEPETTPEPAPLQLVDDDPPAHEDASTLDALRLDIAGTVATALLTKVVEIVTSPDQSKQAVLERDDARRRLAETLEDNQRHRETIRRIGEELAAAHAERDGLRQRLRAADANVAKLTAPNAAANAVVNDLVQNELAKVMRAAPQPHSHGEPD